MIVRRFFMLLALALLPLPAAAQGWTRIVDESQFVQLVGGRDLRLALFGVTLQVLPDGRITGRASGRDVSGNWRWQDGFFCREMAWGNQPVAYNCQLAEAAGDRIRFTSDRGAGRSAAFALR